MRPCSVCKFFTPAAPHHPPTSHFMMESRNTTDLYLDQRLMYYNVAGQYCITISRSLNSNFQVPFIINFFNHIYCLVSTSGLAGVSVGCTYAAIKKQNLLTYSFSTGASFFTISGMFFGEFAFAINFFVSCIPCTPSSTLIFSLQWFSWFGAPGLFVHCFRCLGEQQHVCEFSVAQLYFKITLFTKHLMTSPNGNSKFCFPMSVLLY